MPNNLPPLPSLQSSLLARPSQKSASTGAAAPGSASPSATVALPYAQYLDAVDKILRGGDFAALSSGGNAVLTVAGGQNLTGGFTETPFDFGSVTSGTITPNPSKCLKQKVTNNGAFTIAATAEVGDVELLVINGASAGAITLSGFTKQFTSDPFDTTNGHKFVVFIYGFDAGVTGVLVRSLQ